MNVNGVDWVVIISANIFNLAIVGIMLSRVHRKKKLERLFGLISVGLIVPFGIALVINFIDQRAWWFWGLPGLISLFLVIEAILDYVLHLDFRKSRWLGPYLLVFYLAQWGLVGYTFIADETWGLITLVTYFLSLGATAFSYKKVKHG